MDTMKKILTIVIPTYNMEQYLDKCLSSLILDDRELMESVEVLVVIDGAKDNSSTIAHTYKEKFPKTYRVIDKENGNYGSCINRGLYEATGKYIKVLDADDTFDTINYEKFLRYLLVTKADCVLTPMIQVSEDGKELKTFSCKLRPEELITLDELGTAADNMWMHCVCYNTEKVRALGYMQTEGISYTDQEWICVPMAAMDLIAYYPSVVYRYLVGREGQTIDTAVWNKNFWMEIKGAIAMIEGRVLYGEIVSERGLRYINVRIRKRCKTIYKAYLYWFKDDSNFSKVLEFDQYLKSNAIDIYNYTDSVIVSCIYPYHYILDWRKNHKLNPIKKNVGRMVERLLSCVSL